jgi:cytochrome c oxidase subunit 4
MSGEHAAHPYYKVFAWLTVLTVVEIAWAIVFLGDKAVWDMRMVGVLGLAGMAAVKAALVGLYYMHLKYEGRLIWGVILFPLLLVVVMVAGLLPDALSPYGG